MNPAVLTPAMYLTHMLPDSESTIFYATNTAKQLAGRDIVIPAGGILGGGSSTNAMMYVNCRIRFTPHQYQRLIAGSNTRHERYTRAQRSDYDSWNTKGWSTDEVLPYLKKVSQKSPLPPFSSPLTTHSLTNLNPSIQSRSWKHTTAQATPPCTATTAPSVYPTGPTGARRPRTTGSRPPRGSATRRSATCRTSTPTTASSGGCGT